MKKNKFHVDIKKSLFFAWYRFDIMLLTIDTLYIIRYEEKVVDIYFIRSISKSV